MAFLERKPIRRPKLYGLGQLPRVVADYISQAVFALEVILYTLLGEAANKLTRWEKRRGEKSKRS